MRNARAFTLVEMLLVIGIIAGLVAIMVPVLHMVKGSGRAAKCMTNLSNAAQALSKWSSDNRNTTVYADQWAQTLANMGAADRMQGQTIKKDRGALRCPDDLDDYAAAANQINPSATERTSTDRSKVTIFQGTDSQNQTFYVQTSYGINGSDVTSGTFGKYPHTVSGSSTGPVRLTQIAVSLEDLIMLYDGLYYHVGGFDMHSTRHVIGMDVTVVTFSGVAVTAKSINLSSTYSADGPDKTKRPTHWYQ